MNIVYFGTPEFALPALDALAAAEKENSLFKIKAVVTQPDKKKGRAAKKLTPSPVKECAQEKYSLTVLE
ncbi:methionyl-tRNA formyltransferase, partial [Candidatus Magnetoovum chiemensis]